MARRRYSRRYPYRTRRRAYTSGSRSKRRVIGNYRAALQQRDATQVNLSIPTNITVSYKDVILDGNEATSIKAGTFALNIWDLLRKSEFYQSYANMYDQVKIDRVKIKLTPLKFYITNASLYSSYTIVSAWDRSGLSDSQLRIVHNVANNFEASVIGSDQNKDGLYVNVSPLDLSTYSSAVTKNVNPNSNTAINRYLWPSSMQEKSMYVNTADIKAWYEGYDEEDGRYYGIPRDHYITASDAENNGNHFMIFPGTANQTAASSKNPCYLEESPLFAWKPTLLVGVMNEAGTVGTVEIKNEIQFSVEADIGVTFRGLRKASVVAFNLIDDGALSTEVGKAMYVYNRLPARPQITYNDIKVANPGVSLPPVQTIFTGGQLDNVSKVVSVVDVNSIQYLEGIEFPAATASYRHNGTYTVDFMASTQYTFGKPVGSFRFTIDVDDTPAAPELRTLTVYSTNIEQVFTPVLPYVGYSQVTVLEADSYTPNLSLTSPISETFYPDGHDYFAAVNVSPTNQSINSYELTYQNKNNVITPSIGYSGIGSITVQPKLHVAKFLMVDQDGIYTIRPDTADGYIGMEAVQLTVSTGASASSVQTKTVNISTNGQTVITPDSGYNGLSSVTVNTSVPTNTVPLLTKAYTGIDIGGQPFFVNIDTWQTGTLEHSITVPANSYIVCIYEHANNYVIVTKTFLSSSGYVFRSSGATLCKYFIEQFDGSSWMGFYKADGNTANSWIIDVSPPYNPGPDEPYVKIGVGKTCALFKLQ